MCSDTAHFGKSDGAAIRADRLGKCYHLYDRPGDRLKQFLWRGRRRYYREFQALQDVSFEVMPGEVIGIVGRNGAGKSTLLQLICGTLTPSSGEISVRGRVAALLELGAGFNPEFTGRENVFISAAIMGLSPAEITARFEEIVDFSGVRDFIDQPVKTYSSGMYVRLAFSVAISVDPDILVIDEALSVGDGAFARKSFDRIMALKNSGKTILFCSHSMYHIDVLCQRAIWLEHGKLRMLDSAMRVTSAYNADLARESQAVASLSASAQTGAVTETQTAAGRIVRVSGKCENTEGTQLAACSRTSIVSVTVEFIADPALPPPTVALSIETVAGIPVSSVISLGHATVIDSSGRGKLTAVFPQIPLLKGEYHLTAFLACELGLNIYDYALHCLTLDVSQEDRVQGLVALPHAWHNDD